MKDKLLNDEARVGVWGLGFIGYSSMAHLASRGVRCLGTDTDRYKVDCVNQGRLPVPNIGYWLGFNTEPLSEQRIMRATTSWEMLISSSVAAHLVCVPTEKDSAPYLDILRDVVGKLSCYAGMWRPAPPLVIIESTLTPGTTDSVVTPILEEAGLKVGADILVGVAPRRDWFVSAEKNLKTLPRVVGGTTSETTDLMKDILGLICDTVLPAKDHRHAELVKGIENAYRHVEITLANQLSLAYPGIDMRDVLRLVGTKWNIGTFQPSFGTGGYCIPLSSQYILSGALDRAQLSILQTAVATDKEMPTHVADSLVQRGANRVGVLGLAYKGDLKVHILSPTLRIADRLKELGKTVKVHDPYYSAEEINQICGVETFTFPDGLEEFDAVLLVSDHRAYQYASTRDVLRGLRNCRIVLDNTGVWSTLPFNDTGVEYHLAGTENWLGAILQR